jgi:DNA mismatch endonuclease (patch repair protein)
VNVDYWAPKIERNIARDAETTRALTEAGWHVVRVWEHEDLDAAAADIECLLTGSLGLRPGTRPKAEPVAVRPVRRLVSS